MVIDTNDRIANHGVLLWILRLASWYFVADFYLVKKYLIQLSLHHEQAIHIL